MKVLSYPPNYWNTAAVAVEAYLDRYPKSAVEVRIGDKLAYRAYGAQETH